MRRAFHLYTLALAAILTIAFFSSNFYAGETEEVTAGDDKLPQVIRAIDLDRPFSFAGERVPMENFDVRERLDRELIVNSYRHSSTILNIKNAHKYFPIIEPILMAEGIPDDFKFLAMAESDLRNATSPAGAKGFWQFMEPVAEHYGLEVNREVDERYHIEKATYAACAYLKDVKERFGSWTMAAAAYNMGGTRLAKELRAQGTSSYYDMNLNEETSRYVFRLLALKEIVSHPDRYGFQIEDDAKYTPMTDFQILTVDTTIHDLGAFARDHGITYRMLKVYNPWMIESHLPNSSRKRYQIKIPTS